jgi:sugar-phosphatase
MLRAAIFDMDGLLVDSEPLWRRAEQQVFPAVGIELTDAMCMQTMGTRLDEVVRYWYGLHPWTGPTQDEVAAQVIARVIDLVAAEGQALPGVAAALARCAAAGLAVALASSSPMRLIDAVVDRLGIRAGFTCLQSAEDEPYGKPHPGVFLTTAARLGVEPSACLVLEDSLAGVLAGKAARMRVVAVPAREQYDDPRFVIADRKLPSLLALDDDVLAALQRG